MLVIQAPMRSDELAVFANGGESFSESVPSFRYPGRDRLIALLSLKPGLITHIARAKRGRASATNRHRINFTQSISVPPIAISELEAALPSALQSRMQATLQKGGLIAPKPWALVEEALSRISPATRDAIATLIPIRERVIGELSHHAREIMALEHETVAVAMRIAGFDDREREAGVNWRPTTTTYPASFLDGLGAVPLREDTMIINDMQIVPGFQRLDQTKFGSVRFENDTAKLFVLHANHQRLEETIGVDLIYYNHSYASFVCVQYKAMERETSGAVFRFPQNDLDKEVDRIDCVLDLINKMPRCKEPHGFRLCENPFYLKFCPRVVFEPDKPDLIRGMYLPLEYWKRLERHDCTLGSRRGRILTFENAGRHFDNTGFISLVSKGWIGSDPEQSATLGDLVNAILAGNQAVTLAVKFDKKGPGSASASLRSDLSDEITASETPPRPQYVRVSLFE
ncbi:hypothetical protein [Azospirillum agricola]|uniref:hypothetical protein n=1 Tax=Azospirillum agricola TaxID=1720247 RepID=UPI0011784519|nr:hypothetical protein [Azospirillum agricola]